jgi:KaiC/GvpD/RAD55 family RecA-like ATPase
MPSRSRNPRSGILAVWGSPGSGKTITAVKIAKHLADRKKNVVLLSVRYDRTHAALHLSVFGA